MNTTPRDFSREEHQKKANKQNPQNPKEQEGRSPAKQTNGGR